MKYLDPEKRVTVTRLYRLCGQANELYDFLEVAGAERDELEQVEKKDEESGVEFKEEVEDGSADRTAEIGNKLSWFTTFCSKLAKPKYKKELTTNTHLNWIYGIELSSIERPLLALEGPIVLYVVSNKMVVYEEAINQQKIYNQHKR